MNNKVKSGITGSVILLVVAALAGCAGQARTATPPVQGTPAMNETARAVLSGKVVETMDAGGYTYINLEKDGKTGWVAVPTMAVKVGDEVELIPGVEMGPFASKSLNRTFDKILFSAGPVVKPTAQPAVMPSGHPTLPAVPAAKKEAAVPAKKEAATPPVVKATGEEKLIYSGKVVETMSSGGYTYICLEKDGKTGWAAVPPTDVKIGDEIEIRPGTEMGRFTSKTLNRTFDNIVFSVGIVQKK